MVDFVCVWRRVELGLAEENQGAFNEPPVQVERRVDF